MKGGGSVKTPSPEDYMPLIQQQADINRIDQVTPFGGIRYVQPEGPKALGFDDWMATDPNVPTTGGYSTWEGGKGGDNVWVPGGEQDFQGAYDNYVTDFTKSNPIGQPTAEAYFSPEIESLFNQQFDPDAYNQYGDDYFANAKRYLDPVYENQTERFQQTMANRGQPVGGELYDDSYGNLMDAQNKGWENAAFGAQQASDRARLEDYNRLMTAMGMNTIASPNIDVMGPANMAFNANATNAANDSQSNSDMWNTAATVAAAYFMSSKDYKTDKTPVNTLDKLVSMPVERWKYKDGISDGGEHIGPYAEDFKERFGVGDGKTINMLDMMGVLMRSVQELAQEVRSLK